MILEDVMEQVADQLATITGLRVYGYPVDKAEAPAAVVSYPEGYAYDATYGRGMDRIENLPVVVLVGKVSDRNTRERVSQYVDGSGAKSIKQVLQSGTYTAFDTIRVARVEFDDFETNGGVQYLAATFTLDIAGRGTS